MKKIVVLFYLALYSCSLLAQNVDQDKVKQYYKLINNAELLLSQKQYHYAKEQFALAFSSKFPNDKDLYNAFLTAYYTKDSLLTRAYMNQLAYMGLSKSYFSDSIFAPNLYNYALAQFDSCFNAGLVNQKSPMWSVLIADFDPLQISRKELVDDYGQIITERNILDSIKVEKLIQYFSLYGFPSFERVGFRGQLSSLNNDWLLYFVISLEQTSQKTKILNHLLKPLLNGELRPDIYAAIQTTASNTTFSKDEFGLGHRWYTKPPNEDELQEINKRRAEILLEPYSDFEQKRLFDGQNNKRRRSQYKPNLYPANESIREQFVLFCNLYIFEIGGLGQH